MVSFSLFLTELVYVIIQKHIFGLLKKFADSKAFVCFSP